MNLCETLIGVFLTVIFVIFLPIIVTVTLIIEVFDKEITVFDAIGQWTWINSVWILGAYICIMLILKPVGFMAL